MGFLDISAQIGFAKLALIAVIELCSGFVLINSSLTVMLGATQEWLKRTFAIPLLSGIVFLCLVISQSLGIVSFDTLQPGTALLFALYSIFSFLLSWNIHKRQGSA